MKGELGGWIFGIIERWEIYNIESSRTFHGCLRSFLFIFFDLFLLGTAISKVELSWAMLSSAHEGVLFSSAHPGCPGGVWCYGSTVDTPTSP